MQETLNNIAKHAKAEHVRIHLRKIDSGIELLVQDNGTGFDLDSLAQRKGPDKGFGITGMRERTEFSGGNFFITSDKKTGTTMRVTWPCQHRDEAPNASSVGCPVESLGTRQ